MAPKVLHLSTYDANGGAAKGAHRLHRAMVERGLPSRMHVAVKGTDDPTVTAGSPWRHRAAQEADRRLWRVQRSPVETWRSPARFGSLSADAINRSSADIVNLHWVTDGFLSIEAIGAIRKPIVWSLYDMWAFTGTEHYVDDGPSARWRSGYTTANRPDSESGVDLDRWAFERKQEHWNPTRMTIVPASTWLTDSAAQSRLMTGWNVRRIPHVMETDAFAPSDRAMARQALDLPAEAPLVLFVASAGITDRRKGWDLLSEALPRVKRDHPDLQVVVAGPVPDDAQRTSAVLRAGVPIRWCGPVSDSRTMALLYSATDVTAVPSREDNLPLVALEAQSSGRPVVALRIGGLPDIVEQGETGHLARLGDARDLAQGISTFLDPQRNQRAGHEARQRALSLWSPETVVAQYRALYDKVMA